VIGVDPTILSNALIVRTDMDIFIASLIELRTSRTFYFTRGACVTTDLVGLYLVETALKLTSKALIFAIYLNLSHNFFKDPKV
jgi:hypothetical protein